MAFLAIGTLGEQVKTRLEVANEEKGVRDVSNQPVVELPSGVTYQDLRIGAGAQPRKGDLVVLDYKCGSMPMCPCAMIGCLRCKHDCTYKPLHGHEPVTEV